MANVTIRQGQKEDIKEIAQMIKSLAEFQKMNEYPDENNLLQDGFESQPPRFHILVAQTKDADDKQVLVGMVCYSFMYAATRGRMGFMSGFYVIPKYRNRGVGDKLYNAVKTKIFEERCIAMRFFTIESNTNALKFYTNRGATDLYKQRQLLTFTATLDEEITSPPISKD